MRSMTGLLAGFAALALALGSPSLAGSPGAAPASTLTATTATPPAAECAPAECESAHPKGGMTCCGDERPKHLSW